MEIESDWGRLTLEVEWRNEAGDIVVTDKIPYVFPKDVVHLPYPSVIGVIEGEK